METKSNSRKQTSAIYQQHNSSERVKNLVFLLYRLQQFSPEVNNDK